MNEKSKIEAEASKFEADNKAAKKLKSDIKHSIAIKENAVKILETRLSVANERKEAAIKEFETELVNNQSQIELFKLEKQKEVSFLISCNSFIFRISLTKLQA